MKFNKKYKVLFLRRYNPMHQNALSAIQLESSLAEKYLRVLVDQTEHKSAIRSC